MPNTLAHFGVQGPATRAVFPGVDGKWILLGCIIPDIPWILRRVVRGLWPGLDPYDLLLYAGAQASFAVCLLLCAALALITPRPKVIFAVLGVNSVLGLVLDALQTKWANGVHLFAPLSWELLNFDLFWPDAWLNYLLTALGLGVFFWFAAGSPGEPIGLFFRGRLRILGAVAFLLSWAIIPFGLMSGPQGQNNYYSQTLRETGSRAGRTVELDRAGYFLDEGREYVRTFTGEALTVTGETLGRPGVVSVRGTFIDNQTILIHELHEHRGLWRDWASILGLSLLLVLWAVSLWQSNSWRSASERQG